MLLGCTGWLMADIPDPTIRLSIPGTGTFPLCTVGAAGESCTTTLIDGEPDTTIGDNGFGSFAVKNVDPFLAIDSINFFFQTDNLDQAFSASTDDFSTINIIRHFSCDGEFCPGPHTVLRRHPTWRGSRPCNYFRCAGAVIFRPAAGRGRTACHQAQVQAPSHIDFPPVDCTAARRRLTSPCG